MANKPTATVVTRKLRTRIHRASGVLGSMSVCFIDVFSPSFTGAGPKSTEIKFLRAGIRLGRVCFYVSFISIFKDALMLSPSTLNCGQSEQLHRIMVEGYTRCTPQVGGLVRHKVSSQVPVQKGRVCGVNLHIPPRHVVQSNNPHCPASALNWFPPCQMCRVASHCCNLMCFGSFCFL